MKSDDAENVPWLAIVLWTNAGLLAVFLLYAGGYGIYKTWAPRYEDARRETFEHSRAFIRGKQQYLRRLYADWKQADEGHKGALCAIARDEADDLQPKDLPAALAAWECVK